MSTKPGRTFKPEASIIFSEVSETSPTLVITPFLMPRSPRNGSAPLPSIISPFLIIKSSIYVPELERLDFMHNKATINQLSFF